MPNCDFYATPEDHRTLLTWLLAEKTCDVYEQSSDYEQPLKQFHEVDEVLAQFEKVYTTGKRWTSVALTL